MKLSTKVVGMVMSLIIKYFQENTELRMRMRIMLEGRTAIDRSDLSSGVMSPTRPGSLHPEQLIYYIKNKHHGFVALIICR